MATTQNHKESGLPTGCPSGSDDAAVSLSSPACETKAAVGETKTESCDTLRTSASYCASHSKESE